MHVVCAVNDIWGAKLRAAVSESIKGVDKHEDTALFQVNLVFLWDPMGGEEGLLAPIANGHLAPLADELLSNLCGVVWKTNAQVVDLTVQSWTAAPGSGVKPGIRIAIGQIAESRL